MPVPEFIQPAEWSKHRAVWMAWPSHAELWEDNLEPAQYEFVELCRAIASIDPVTGVARGEFLEILVPSQEQKALAQVRLAGLPVRFHELPFGDIWLRDTAPIFVFRTNPLSAQAELVASTFRFNGWGGKYALPHDTEVAARVAEASGKQRQNFDFVLEGGSIEVDGDGTGLTSEQCLLNPNRNPDLSRAEIEEVLKNSLGLHKVLWVKEGLINDHTDGHIDTIARFVAPGKVVCMKAMDPQDPNAAILEQIANELAEQVDASGRKLEVIRIPSPGVILDEEGELMPASYVNFYIGNASVVVPTYGSLYDGEAVASIAKLFPEKQVVGCSAFAILSGGGAFHCITQQEPAW
jgi:agmatine deiminase